MVEVRKHVEREDVQGKIILLSVTFQITPSILALLENLCETNILPYFIFDNLPANQ